MPRDADGLTPRQAAFTDEYVADPSDGGAAAVRAGFKPSRAHVTACELLKKPEVQAVIERKRAALSARTGETASKVLGDLRMVADRCMQAVPVLDKDGEPTGEWRFDAHGANRALELIGKHLQMFVERHHHEGLDLGAFVAQISALLGTFIREFVPQDHWEQARQKIRELEVDGSPPTDQGPNSGIH